MPMSFYLQNRVLQATLQGDVFTWPTAMFVGLHTADPTASTATALTTEVTGNGYLRQAATFTEPDGSYLTFNTADITFGPANPNAWGAITFISIWDAASSGNLLYYGALSSTVTINALDSFLLASGGLSIQFTI
jgi:hypothetical protein